MKSLFTRLHRLVLASALAMTALPALAGVDLVGHDTDLFTTNPNIPAQVPNVLIVLDNTSNWSAANQAWTEDARCTAVLGSSKDKQGDMELCALYRVIANLDEQIAIGIMEINDQEAGGFVRFPIKQMNTTNKAALQARLVTIATNGVGDNNEKTSSNTGYDFLMEDAWRYFNSLGTYTGTTSNLNTNRDAGAYSTDLKSFKFTTGLNTTSCGTDYIIFIGNTFPNSQTLSFTNAISLVNDPDNVKTSTVDTSKLNTLASNKARTPDNWTKFMYYYGVKISNGVYRPITTYTLDVCQKSCSDDQAILLKSMANVSQGKYYRVTTLDGIETALKAVFAEVQAVNSVFAATTLPVSINVRGTNLNQVYIGVFRPDSTLSQRWLGNLKHYKLGVVSGTTTGQLQLIDANDAAAVNLNTGFISNGATSIWTEKEGTDSSSTDGFWGFRTSFAATDVGKDEDAPDGDLVEKGGAAQKLRQFYKYPDSATLNSDGSSRVRKIYTCTGTCTTGSALKDYLFNTSNSDITSGKLGTLSTTSVTSITGSGTTATVTTPAAHGFVAGNSIVIAGASPSYYNGTYTVLSSPAPTSTTFAYTVTPTPSATVDTTNAYATYSTTVAPSKALVTGTDLVTVTGASPAAYQKTAVATAAVSGASNQFSYAISSTSGAASGYAVTALRKLSSLVWTSGVVTATTTGTTHGYSAADSITISGATDSVFNNNGPYTITEIPSGSTSSFKFNLATTPSGVNSTTGVVSLDAATPSAWGNTPTLLVCGVGTSSFDTSASSCTTTVPSTSAQVCIGGSTCSGVTPDPSSTPTGRYFTYTTNANVSGTPVITGATVRRAATDTSTFVPSGASFATGTINTGTTWGIQTIAGAGTTSLTFTINTARLTDSSQAALRTLAVGDQITINATSCTYRVGAPVNTNFSCAGQTYTIASVSSTTASSALSGGAVPTTSAQNLAATMTVSVTVATANLAGGGNAPAISGGTMVFSGTSTGKTGVTFTLSRGQFTDQALLTLAAGNSVTIAGTCSYTVAGAAQSCLGTFNVVAVNGDSSLSSGTVAATYADLSTNTVTVTVATTNVAHTTSANPTINPTSYPGGTVPAVLPTTIARTGTSISSPLTSTSGSPRIVGVSIGPQSVTAAGTIYSAKTGDLTSVVSSITSQGTATGTITVALASSADPNERENLIDWVRGKDNKDNENQNSDSTDIRASIHADVLHSRPAVVNYNRYGDENDVYIFYGTNDGMLRAVKGGAKDKGSSLDGGGKEQWAFIPSEFFGRLKRIRDQTPTISSSNPRDYGFDGPIAIYTRDGNSDGKYDYTTTTDKVYLYVSMRRGGRMMFAFDISNPLDPKLLWKKGCSDSTGNGNASGSGGCDTGFEQMGQTWSEPKLGYLRKWPDTLALMFAAGNDSPAEVPQPCMITDWTSGAVQYRANATVPSPMSTANCPPTDGTVTSVFRTMGRGIYILNAETGAILWRAGPESAATRQVAEMTYAMPGDLAVMKNQSNTSSRTTSYGTESVTSGYIDRIYATDTGGNVWRFDVADASGAASVAPAFVVSRLAMISDSTTSGTHVASNYRKFLFNPDVVYASGYDAVLIGSGDREHPFDQIVNNRFYMFKDKNTGTLVTADVNTTSTDMTVKWAAPTTGVIKDTTTSSDLVDLTTNCIQTSSNCTGGDTSATVKAALSAAKGWKVKLSTSGEKTVAPATTAAGTVIFNTNEPKGDTVTGTASACTSDLGTARQYGLSYSDATATYIFSTLPSKYVPSAGGGRYAVFSGGGFLPQPVPVVVQIGGKYYQTVIAGVQTTNPGGLKLQSRVRTYWYRKID